ncbi:hypothetical protein [Chelonobacter oris]|uniref:hypothetical protein n=1 Tax=Chelonobacter oris TaxID=505317 RepID=UPI002447D24D|nr:hypothetical protein [Chelonobacter oris]
MFKTLLKGITTAVQFSAAAHAATLDEIKSRGYMSIATEDNYAPFEIIEGGKPQPI